MDFEERMLMGIPTHYTSSMTKSQEKIKVGSIGISNVSPVLTMQFHDSGLKSSVGTEASFNISRFWETGGEIV
jgi:hypothetical protein